LADGTCAGTQSRVRLGALSLEEEEEAAFKKILKVW
jgi:hypothetical protein